MLSITRNLAACVVVSALCLGVHSRASADTYSFYASVSCMGDNAVVSFDEYPDPQKPDFAGDPSHCVLTDGRHITLRQNASGNVRSYGTCGTDETQVFSLWIGLDEIYSREAFHNKCDSPYSIQSIRLDGVKLLECRVHILPSQTLSPPECVDQSQRLRNPSRRTGPLGKLLLMRHASNTKEFCRAFVGVSSYLSSATYWPTLRPLGNREIFTYPDGAMTIDPSDGNFIDIDNDFRPDRIVRYELHSGGVDEIVLGVLPQGAADDDADTLKYKLAFADGDRIRALRIEGYTIFAGDQTAFRSVGSVYLELFRYEDASWLHATLPPGLTAESFAIDPKTAETSTDLILRPMPDGTLQEICAFRQTPQL